MTVLFVGAALAVAFIAGVVTGWMLNENGQP